MVQDIMGVKYWSPPLSDFFYDEEGFKILSPQNIEPPANFDFHWKGSQNII